MAIRSSDRALARNKRLRARTVVMQQIAAEFKFAELVIHSPPGSFREAGDQCARSLLGIARKPG
jgi:hypothetical protein